MKIIVSPEIESVCPTFVGACVEASVVNTQYCQELWDEIEELGRRYKQKLTTESLKDMSGIAATRKVYRSCGKDPSRYRPASEERYTCGSRKLSQHSLRLQHRRF